MSLIILVVGVFFLSGCLFSEKHTITFKTNGGSEVENVIVKSGNKITKPKAPKKDGYVFDGWYLDGEEFDFKGDIDDDITLVAKWKKADQVENVTSEGESEFEEYEEETTEKPEETTKAEKTSKTTTKVSGSTTTTKKNTTTKKVTTTTKKTNSGSTTTADSIKTTKATTKTSTTKATTAPTTVPTTKSTTAPTTVPTTKSTTVPTTAPAPVEPTTKPVNDEIKISITNLYTEVTVKFNGDENNNVESTISNVDLEYLMTSEKSSWSIENNKGYVYDLGLSEGMDTNILRLTGGGIIETFTVYISEKVYCFVYNNSTDKWTINYPNVQVGEDLNRKYYYTLDEALKMTEDGSKVVLLNDITTKSVTINKLITIDGNDHKIICNDDYLFNIKEIDQYDKSITIKNFKNINVKSFIQIGDEVDLDKIYLENVTGTYQREISNSRGFIEQTDCNLTTAL